MVKELIAELNLSNINKINNNDRLNIIYYLTQNLEIDSLLIESDNLEELENIKEYSLKRGPKESAIFLHNEIFYETMGLVEKITDIDLKLLCEKTLWIPNLLSSLDSNKITFLDLLNNEINLNDKENIDKFLDSNYPDEIKEDFWEKTYPEIKNLKNEREIY